MTEHNSSCIVIPVSICLRTVFVTVERPVGLLFIQFRIVIYTVACRVTKKLRQLRCSCYVSYVFVIFPRVTNKSLSNNDDSFWWFYSTRS